jgi:hypothetical protein
VRTLRGPNCDLDHFLVTVKIKQRIKKAESGAHKKPKRWAIEKLKNKEIAEEYKRKAEEKIE